MKVEVFDKKKRDIIYVMIQFIYALLILGAGYLMALGWTAMMEFLRGWL